MHLLETTLVHPRESTIITTLSITSLSLKNVLVTHIPNVLDGSWVQDCLRPVHKSVWVGFVPSSEPTRLDRMVKISTRH